MASIVPSRREFIFQAILAGLQQVQVANGYEIDLAFIRRGDFDPLALPAYPGALVLPLSDDPESGPTSVNRHTLRLVVRVWVRDPAGYAESEYPQKPLGDTPSTLPTQLETALAAVQRAMMRDPRWTGLAEHTDEGRTTYLLLDNQYAECGADIEYTIDYRTTTEDVVMPPLILP